MCIRDRYDSFIHAFSSAGTGGFSNRNASVGAYGSVAIDLIITVFILLFSLNFAVYFLPVSYTHLTALATRVITIQRMVAIIAERAMV